MASIQVNATASLTANGNSQGRGTISWTPPTIPTGSTIDSIVVSGSWSWGGKGNINNVTINGTNTSADTAFSVSLGTSASSPLNITCSGNKNATGSSFTWSNLKVTYNYTEPKKYYNVSVGTVQNGTVTLSSSGSVEENTVVSITATPNANYEVGTYYVNGVAIGGNSFTVTQDSVVTVTFIEITEKMYIKNGSAWQEVSAVYKKVGGTWQLQNNIQSVMDSSVKYVRKN